MYLTNLLFPRSYFDIVTIEFTALILTELLNTTTMVRIASLRADPRPPN